MCYYFRPVNISLAVQCGKMHHLFELNIRHKQTVATQPTVKSDTNIYVYVYLYKVKFTDTFSTPTQKWTNSKLIVMYHSLDNPFLKPKSNAFLKLLLVSNRFIFAQKYEWYQTYIIVPNHYKITICNLYLPPKVKVSVNQLENLLYQLPSPFILLGDFNGHNQIWGSKYTDSRGKKIEKIINNQRILLWLLYIFLLAIR